MYEKKIEWIISNIFFITWCRVRFWKWSTWDCLAIMKAVRPGCQFDRIDFKVYTSLCTSSIAVSPLSLYKSSITAVVIITARWARKVSKKFWQVLESSSTTKLFKKKDEAKYLLKINYEYKKINLDLIPDDSNYIIKLKKIYI